VSRTLGVYTDAELEELRARCRQAIIGNQKALEQIAAEFAIREYKAETSGGRIEPELAAPLCGAANTK